METKITYKHYRIPKFVTELLQGEVPLREVALGDVVAYSVRYRRNTKDFVPSGNGGYTTCTISDGEFSVTGIATCSPGDAFSYKVGREVAYERALKLWTEL